MTTTTHGCGFCSKVSPDISIVLACQEKGIFRRHETGETVEHILKDGSRATSKLGALHIEEETHAVSFTAISPIFGKRDVRRVADKDIVRVLTPHEVEALNS